MIMKHFNRKIALNFIQMLKTTTNKLNREKNQNNKNKETYHNQYD